MHSLRSAGSRFSLLGGGLLLLLVPLLITVPRLVPPNPTVTSAAAVEGYNSVVAYWVVLLWCAVAGLTWLVAGRLGWVRSPTELIARPHAKPSMAAIVGVALAVVVVLWPQFLVRYGPYTEESIFLNATHRMLSGLVPFRDFEFLYGPLMLYPVYGWMKWFGYSVEHYYWYLAVLEALQFALIAGLVWRLVPDRRGRWITLGLLALLLANPLLGLNYNGFRRLLPIAAAVVLARRPTSLPTALGAGALFGLSLAYSHEYGIAGLIGSGVMLLGSAIYDRDWRCLRSLALAGATAVLLWFGISQALLGDSFPAYLAEARLLVARFGAGEAGFRFYWTVNALAGFALLFIALGLLAVPLGAGRRVTIEPGDRFLVAAVAMTGIHLKSGLNRADLWHLSTGFLPLAIAFLLPLPRRLTAGPPGVWRLAGILIGVLALTHTIGQMPLAAYVAQGWVRGARDVATGVHPPTAPAVSTEAPEIETAKTHPRPAVLALTQFLADSGRRGQTVFFYGTLWGLGKHVGVPKRDRLNDDFLYSDQRGEDVRAWLEQSRVPFVVMDRAAYERLFETPNARIWEDSERRSPPSLVKTLGAWTATVHYRGLEVERPLQDARWKKTIGNDVRANYRPTREFGDFIVLERRTTP